MHGHLAPVGCVLGILIVIATGSSVVTTLVVPRATSSRALRSISKILARATHSLVRILPGYEAKDRVMALVGPLAMVLLFVSWLASLVVGFGLIIWWQAGTTVTEGLTIAGSSVFTLGTATSHAGGVSAVEIIAAGTGLLVVALEIAYLPAMYAAFSVRETEVTLLATRAGVPAWGPEVLARHHWFHTMAALPELYSTWERWSAGVAESHAGYPSLMWFRSPVPWRHWLTSLTAVLDAAALHNALNPGSSPRQARVCIQMGTHSLRSLADALHIPYDADPLPTDPIRLTEAEFREGVARLEEVGFPCERTAEEAWPHFCGWRVNYESIVDGLAREVIPPPTPWQVPRPWLGELRRPVLRNRTPDDPLAEAPRQPLK